MERKARWRDHVKATPYVSPLQAFSSNGKSQEVKQKTFHCPVCLGRYLEHEERPKKLPCDHFICLLCYKNIKTEGVNHCPICQVQHKFIRNGLSFDSDSDATNNNDSSLDSSQNLDLSETSLDMQIDQTDIPIETNHCHEHSFKNLDLYCNIHDIRICSECKNNKHNLKSCTVISCEQEMKERKRKAGQSIDSKIHLMTKLNSRITEFLDTLKKEDPRNSQEVEDQISAVHGLLEEVKVKQIFLSDAKRDIEKQETWEIVLSACGDSDLKILYIDNSLKDMYTKLEAIRLHYTVRQQIGYGEASCNSKHEELVHEEEERSSKSKPEPTENKGSSELCPNNIQKNENQVKKEEKRVIFANNDVGPDHIDGSTIKIKHEKQSQLPQDKGNLNKKTKLENSQPSITVTGDDIKLAIFHNDPKNKINDFDKENPSKENGSCDLSKKADGLKNMKNIANETIEKSFENEPILKQKYKSLENNNQKFNDAKKIKCIDDNNGVNLGVFNEEVNIFKVNNKIIDKTDDADKNLIVGTKSIESNILLKKLLSDTKRQKDLKISEVNKLSVCLLSMFILSSIFYFLFSRENNMLNDDLSNALSQKDELETLIEHSVLEINALQQKIDETISQRDFFHLKLNEALIMQGRESDIIQEFPQIQNEETSWYGWIGSLLYYSFYFIFRLLMLTGSFIVLSIGGQKLNEDYLSLNISDNIDRSISMVVFFLLFYEGCGIVTWVTTLPLVTSPLFSWYQPGNLFIVDGIRMFFPWMFAHSGLFKWLSTALVGIMVLALSVYIMSEISENMKSRGVDKQNHDAFFIISWPLLCVAISVFLVWLSFLPIT